MSDLIVIIGAGVSGLAAAATFHRRGRRVLVLESSDRAGGAARAFRREGYLCEEGPNTLLLSRPETRCLLQETGLLDTALDAAPQAQKRYVVRGGRLLPLPASPPAFLASPVLSWRAKARLLFEPFLPRGTDPDETLAQFVRRRLGEEPLRELVDPFVSGVYAGDPARLVVRHALPRLYRLEQTHGSLIRGAMKSGGGTAPKGRLISWEGGLGDLAAGLARPLGQSLRLNTTVRWLRREDGVFRIGLDGEIVEAGQVILATDTGNVLRLVGPLFGGIAPLREIPFSPIAVIHLGFPRGAVGHPLDGFGALISRHRKIRALGALFSSTLFPNRAPEGHVLLTVFIGGAHDPQALDLDDPALVGTALGDLGPLLKIGGAPVFQNVLRWPRAIPQYDRHHAEVLRACEGAEAVLPGLRLIGNFRGGISMNDCLANAAALAESMSTCG